MTPTSDELMIEQITADLRSRAQFSAVVPGSAKDEIERVRKLARRAARQLGWKVRTFVTAPDHDVDGRCVITVVVTESNPAHEELQRVRVEKAKREAVAEISYLDTD